MLHILGLKIDLNLHRKVLRESGCAITTHPHATNEKICWKKNPFPFATTTLPENKEVWLGMICPHSSGIISVAARLSRPDQKASTSRR